MKLKEYIETLNKIAKSNPEYLDLDVVYSRDIEGNGFKHVYYDPSVGFFEDGEFKQNDWDDEISLEEINAICIN